MNMPDFLQDCDDDEFECPSCGAREDEECEPDCDFDDEDSFTDQVGSAR